MNTATFLKFTEMAYQFGPFFFALLFTLVISRWAYKIYHVQHKSTDKEKETYRWIFISTTGFGMILVIISVIWWWNYRPTTYIFRGEVKDLQEYERITSKNLYFKSIWDAKLGENIPQSHSEEFVVIQDRPFSKNQKFDIRFQKGPEDKNPKSLAIKYCPGDKTPGYKIVWEDSLHESQVELDSESIASKDNGFRLQFFDRAYAKKLPSGKSDPLFQIANQAANKTENIVRVLQDENTDVASKIAALDNMRSLDENSRSKLVRTKTSKEDMMLTLCDLTRHTDRELAYKAQLLIQAMNIDTILAARLNSKNASTVRDAQQIIHRLDKVQAASVLKSVNIKQSDEMKRFAEDILSGRGLTPLKPTGSLKGDRYYVKAQWNPNDKKIVDCLTRLFNQELAERPSLQEEAKFMKGRSDRWMYWYSKEWALDIAKKIISCGGKASFGTP